MRKDTIQTRFRRRKDFTMASPSMNNSGFLSISNSGMHNFNQFGKVEMSDVISSTQTEMLDFSNNHSHTSH